MSTTKKNELILESVLNTKSYFEFQDFIPPSRSNAYTNFFQAYASYTRFVIYYRQSITIAVTLENFQIITITFTFTNCEYTITFASVTFVTFHYILLQFSVKLRDIHTIL